MNPTLLQIATNAQLFGFAAALVIALVMFALGRKYLSQDRARDKQSGSDREGKDADKAVIEQARATIESERKDTARTVEVRAQAEAARLELDRKEAAGSLEADQRRLMERVGTLEKQERVGDLERNLLAEIGTLTTAIAVLTERVNAVLKRCQERDS